ncbi:hypothetical protein [Polyangium mundeleinium]|uniref:Lipoprotein n=1 Tax=Polyangium mundeleinium TaxID=2995306 RepID=A0ABT5F3Z6_9BACT|nr:hypothetical protein [Polyangium mundeleinium]MDC0748820.1 hypothetical protein [Polyangium mundeleinium]
MPAPPSPAKPLLTFAACIALAACEPPSPQSELFTQDPDAPTPTTEFQITYTIDAATPLLLDLRGSSTGDPYALTCAQNELVVGLRGRSDTTVGALGLICARMQENGTFTQHDERPMIGGTTGEAFSSECPQSEAVIAVRGRAGTTLDRIGVRCARVRPWVQMGAPGSIEPSFGGTSGVPFTETCPPGYFLQGLLGYAAGAVHSTQGLCVPIVT